MYHFTAENPPEPVRLSYRALIPGHIRQYLKDFQLEAIRFMHNFLAKGEFCVYNDESGLGKQAAVAVLLDAACSSKKCLLVVQNDDRYVTGWEFHFNVLTKSTVTIIKDEKDSTDTSHNIYIAKWSTLRTIDDLSRLKFDFIILDNRGQMLNNSFCTSMLLKHYERKINILISSVDITSDLKLLHNVLRLGGRLEPQFSSFKIFEEKFKLPEAKELVCKRVDLEEYFCKRERLADYCKAFRLRRYCHQYESMLPLVKEDRYKINLDLWREKQTLTNSESSSVEYVNNQQRGDEHIKDTQELFEEYCRQKRKEHLKFQQEEEKRLQEREREMLKNLEQENEIIYNIDDEVALINETPKTTTAITEKSNAARDNSDEPVLMSPLLVESDSDADDLPQICNDSIEGIEIVDLSSEDKDDQNDNNHNCTQDIVQSEEKDDQNDNNDNCSQDIVQPSEKVAKIDETTKKSDNLQKKAFKKKRSFKKRSELARLEEDIVDTLKLETPTKRLITRRSKAEVLITASEKRKQRVNGNEIKKIVPTGTNSVKSKKLNDIKQNQISNKVAQKASNKTDKDLSIKNNSQKPPKEGGNKKDSTDNENCTKPAANQTTANNSNSNVVNSNRKLSSANKKVNGTSVDMDLHKTNATTPDTLRKIVHSEKPLNTVNKTSPKVAESRVQVKKEATEEISPTKRSSSKDLSNRVNSEKIRLKRELEIAPAGIHNKLTRSMKRLTRSAGGSKYLTKNLSLQIDKIAHHKKKIANKLSQKTTASQSKTKMPMINRKPKVNGNNTQTSVISHRSSQDYESIQCAQRLSESAIFDNASEKTSEFLVPNTPNTARNSLLPSSLTSSAGFFAESDVIFVPPSNPVSGNCKKPEQVILLSSSDNENSTSSTQLSTTSRRTRALKPRRVAQSTVGESSKVSSFSELLAQQNTRSNAKSPDLFSNCSDLIHLPCTQPQVENEEPNMPFEGFKIFGSEVKQLQQHYAFNESNNSNKQPTKFKKSQRDQRSCLDILEKMFEPQNKKQKLPNKEKSNITPKKKSPRSATKPQAPILPSHPIEAITETRNLQEQQQKAKRSATSSSVVQDDDIFEITNNGTFGSVMRLHSNGDISPVHHAQKANAKQHNKITNYLIGNSNQNVCPGSQDEVTPNSGNSGGGNAHMEAGTPSKRSQVSSAQNASIKKSPKGKCSSTQATKLTKWFTKPSDQIQIVSKTKTPNSKKTSSMKHIDQEGQNKNVPSTSSSTSPPPTGKRILKRRRLDLSFTK